MRYWSAQGGIGPVPLESQVPLQGPTIFYPGLSALEFHPKERFPWVADLESAVSAIRGEMEDLRKAPAGFGKVYQQYTDEGDWAGAYLWSFGERVDELCERCPETVRLMESLPVAREAGTVFFSALGPNSSVTPHTGNTNAKLRCQLPLCVPGRSVLKVGAKEVRLEEGSAIVFDDSFIHTAWNDSDAARFVLIFDLFHPDLEPIERTKLVEVIQEFMGHSRMHLDQLRGAVTPEWVRGRSQ